MSFLSKTFRYVNEDGGEIVFTYGSGFVINKPNGIDTISVELSKAQGVDQVGATVQSASIQPRPITVSGILCGEWQAASKEKLLAVVRPDLKARLYADDYYVEVRPTATPVIEPRPQFARFQFSLLAAYPYWTQDNTVSVALSGVEPLFRLWDGDETHLAPDGTPGVWNISGQYQFGQSFAAQYINAPNRGQTPVPFTATFLAKTAVENPRITNVETGEYLLLNYTMAANERVVVEITHDRTFVTSSENGDIRGALSLLSTLFRLSVGDNLLKPEAASGQLEVSVAYSPEVVGIAL